MSPPPAGPMPPADPLYSDAMRTTEMATHHFTTPHVHNLELRHCSLCAVFRRVRELEAELAKVQVLGADARRNHMRSMKRTDAVEAEVARLQEALRQLWDENPEITFEEAK